MNMRSRLFALLSLCPFVSSVFGGTVITNNLPANTAIINIDARTDGAANYSGDQSLWYKPFYSAPATQLLAYAVQPGTYNFRVINPADAAQLFPTLTGAQTNQMFTAWTYNSPLTENYLVFPGAAASDVTIPQLFDGAPDLSTYATADAAYNGNITAGFASWIRTGAVGRNGTVFTNSYTFATATNLIFAIPDYALGDNSGGVSVLITPVAPTAMPVVKTWTGAVDANWSTAGNWSPAGVPATNDTIEFSPNSTVNLTSPVTIAGTMNWYRGTLNGAALTIASNGVLNLLTTTDKYTQSAITNAGALCWFGGNFGVSHYSSSYFGLIENLPGAVFDIECDKTVYNPYGNNGLGYINNLGTVQKRASTGNSSIQMAFTNSANVNVQTGTLSFDTYMSITGDYNTSAGAVTRFNSGAFNYTTVPVLGGAGTYQFSGGTLTLLYDTIPNLKYTGGTLTLSTNFQGGSITNLTLNGSALSGSYVVSGALSLADGVTGGLVVTNGATFNWNGGTITGPLDIASTATLNMSTGTANNYVTIRTNAALNFITSGGKTFNYALTNAGTVTWTGGDVAIENLPGNYYGVVENLAGGLWDIQCDNRSVYNPYSNTNSHFHNFGMVRKSAGTSYSNISSYFENAGVVTALTGSIRFNGGGVIESVFNASTGTAINFNGGTFTYNSIPTLNGPGTISLTAGTLVLNNDTIPGLQLVDGSIVLSPNFQQGGAITNLNFGGTLSGNYTVAGTATLGSGATGTLTVLNGGTLTWNGGNIGALVLSNGATVNWNSGTLNTALNIGDGVVVNWASGTASTNVNIAASGVLNMITTGGKTLNSPMTNAGTITWSGGDVAFQNYSGGYNSSLENLPGAVVDIQFDNRSFYNGYGGTRAYFHNAGILKKTAGTGTSTISLVFNNDGVVLAQTGTINFNTGGRIESAFSAAAGAKINFNGGTFSYNTPPTLSGPGLISFTGGTLTLLSDVVPNLQMTGGSLVLSPAFQGGVITNLTLNGSTLQGSYVVAGTLTSADGATGNMVVTNGGTYNWNGGTISGSLDVAGGAVVNWGGGTSTNVNIAAGGALNFVSTQTKTITGGFTNAGTVMWLGGDITVNNYSGGYAGVIENLPSALWDIRCDRTMNNGYGNARAYFHNAGTMQKSVATANTAISIVFNNDGAVNVQSGTITYGLGGRIDGALSAASGANIKFNNGSFFYTVPPTLSGPGVIQLSGGSLALLDNVIPYLAMNDGTVTLATNFQGGTITNLTVPGSVVSADLVVTGTFNCGGGVTGAVTVTISGPLDVRPTALVNWSGGSANGPVNVRTNAAVNLSVNVDKNINNVFTNAGTVTWLDGSVQVNNYNGGYSGGIENLPGALWNIQCNKTMFNNYGNSRGYFHNFGTVQKSAGTGSTIISFAFNNAAVLDTQIGVINFNNGNFTSTGGNLRFGIGGPSSSGQVQINGTVAFDGTLSGALVRGYTGRTNDTISIATYTTRTGAFSKFDLPTLSPGLRWQVNYGATSAQLQIVTNANTTATISGVVTNGTGTGISNVTVYAYATNASSSTYLSALTDTTGHYSIAVSNATWNVGLQNLPALGYDTVAEQTATIAGANQSVNFVVQPYSGQLYTVTTAPNPASAGTTYGDGSFAPGSVVNVSATANTSTFPYYFTNWTENGVFQSANSTYTFLASRDRQLVANFVLPLYTITVSNNPTTAGVVNGVRSNYWGETNVLTAVPNFGYKFTNWTESGVVLSTNATMSNVIYSNRTFVANYAEANLFHDVSTGTSPSGIASVTGAAIYTNGQTGTFTAPSTVVTATNVYIFQKFMSGTNQVATTNSFIKTFATTDATNLQYTAVYQTLSVVPQITTATANPASPVPATTNLQVTFRFDRSMDTNFVPTVVLTNINNASPSAQPVVSGNGTWSKNTLANDTYVTPSIALVSGMDGTNNVVISAAHDIYDGVLTATNPIALFVDATFSVISNVGATPATQSASITWSTDEGATSKVDYGTNTAYGSSSSTYAQLVTLHAITLTGLDPLTTYHYRVRSKDQAGNETVSGDFTFTTLSAPDLQVQNLLATGAFNSGSNIVISWDDANTGAGATYNSWYDLVTVSNLDTHASLLNTTLWYDSSANGNITNGSSKHRQTTFRIPDGPAGVGALQISVTANTYKGQFESSYNNNTQTITNGSALSLYPDLQVANLAVTNAVIQSGKLLAFTWQDTNSGNGPITGSFNDSVTVSNVATGKLLVNTTVGYDPSTAGVIGAGQAAARQYSFTLPEGTAGAGQLVISITTDSGKAIFENNADGGAETNNTASINAVANLAAYADLAPTNVVVPATAAAGQNIQVSWTDLNLGNSTAVGPWSDQVFISDTPNGTGQLLGTFQINNVIAASNSLVITQALALPAFAVGDQWIIVKANAGGSFFENNTANNSFVSAQPITIGSTLRLTLDRTSASESIGSNTVTATVTRNGDTASDLLVTVTNLGLTNVTVPGNIVIPAGQHGATFKVGVVDQHIAGGGSTTETISASAVGFPTASATLQINYDDVAAITIVANTNQVLETAAPGVAFVTVTRNANFGSALTVTLLSDAQSAITVPTSVVIPAGQASVTANLTPIDDNTVADTRAAHILASAPGFGTATATINVLNANTVQLGLVLADSAVSKGAASPATIGTVSRTPVLAGEQKVFLSVGGSSLVTTPSIVTIPAGQESISFNINVGDDHLATGPQQAVISAQVMTPTCQITSQGGTSEMLTVLDTHGPTLSVSFADSVIAKGASTTGTVTRNTPATNAISVNIGAAPSTAVTLPSSVTIPQGQSSATFTISGVLDNTQTGAQKITVAASATGFNSGTANLTISDVYYPDLAPVTVTVPTNALTEQQVTVTWAVTNKGLASATNRWYDYVYLSSDTLGQQASLVAFKTNPVSLVIGATYTNTASFYLPNVPGTYWIVVVSDGGNVVSELNKQNNTLVSSNAMQVQPLYRAMLTSATPQVAPSGTPIVFSGYTYNPQTGDHMGTRTATVRVLINGTRRVFNVVSDASGNFTYTFTPLANEAGDYTAGADYPLLSTDPEQVSFALLGMQSLPVTLSAQLIPNVSVTNYLTLTNLTDHDLTGLQITVPDLQGNLDAQFTLTNTTLEGFGKTTVQYVFSSSLNRVAQIKFGAHVTSDQGAQMFIPTTVNVAPLTPQLSANPGYLQQGMLVGKQTLVSFDIVNTGGAETGDLTMQLPGSLPWMTLSSQAVIPSIQPGAKATVTLALNPPSNLELTEYTGNIAAANNRTGISIQFRFRATSEGKGDLRVTATDDYTYYVSGGPKVTNATVTIRDAITMASIAKTNTDENGIAYFTGLPEGPYVVDASAPQHNPFRGSAKVVNATTNELEAFMTRQLVSYQWTVVPTEVQDEYKIQLESVFETEVPVPNVVVVEPQIMMFVAPGHTTQFEYKLRNEGLIAAQGVTIIPPNDPNYIITPLVKEVGTIPAKSEVSIPVTVQIRTNSGPGLTELGPECGVQPHPCLPKIELNCEYYYPCGANNVVQGRSANLALLCTGKDKMDAILECLKNMKELYGSENFASVGCNAISAFLSCVGPDLDPCVIAGINTACGAATGGAAGAAAGAAGSLPECICAHLDQIPLPSFPHADQQYDGRPDFGLWPILPGNTYSVSGTPKVTVWEFGSCAGAGPSSLSSTTKNIVTGSVKGPKLKAPKAATGGVCARVRVHIDQEVVLTRTAFRGTLDIDNAGDHSISNIKVDLDFRDSTNGVAANKFVTEGPVVSTLTAVDGSGTLNGGASGSAVWTFIPTTDAAPDAPATYQIGGTLSYMDNGQQVVVPLLSAPISVYPEARLDLNYFQQRDVYADDPFTPEVEPSEPFALGLIVKNTGFGNAHNFRITSGQPQIVENEKGLLINFKIIGSQVGNQAQTPSLSATLGDIAPGGAKQVVWDFVSTLQGKFKSFDATFQHINDLGATNTSLINSVNIHELTHKVLANRTTQYDSGAAVIDDNVPDFLVNDIPDPDNLPDVLYLSDGSTGLVNVKTNATVDGPVGAGHLQVHVSFTATNGWNYLQVPDPGVGYLLASVVRSDGKPIALTNDAWTTDRSFPSSLTGAVREHLLHVFDWVNASGTVSYTVTYHSTNTTAPTIVQVGPVTPFVQPNSVSSVNVTFSEQVDLSTFDYRSLTLSRNGGANLITSGSGITISNVSGATYSINGLTALTAVDGNYRLTVNMSGVYDLWGNNGGNTSSFVEWSKGNVAPVVQSFGAVTPNPRKTPVTSVTVTFSKAINIATLDFNALSLTLNGGPNRITPDVTVALQSGSTYTISGLAPLTGDEGNYVLTVNAADVQDPNGTAGSGSKSVTWSTLLSGPRIAALQQVTTNPRNIVVQSLDVTFAGPIDPTTFDYHAVTLTRDGGPNLVTSQVTVTPVNSTTYRVGNINWVQGSAGNYSFSVSATDILDLAGNPGAGSTNVSWQIVLQTPPSPTNVVITPDAGMSPVDGFTRTNSIVLSGTVATTNLTVRVSDTTSGLDFGTAAVTGTNFSLPLSFTSEGQHHLKLVAVDIAGNVSGATYFDAFIDLVSPTAVISPVSPNPTYNPVTNVVVTFSEDINTNTLGAAVITLTRNGTNVAGSPTISATTTKSAVVSGLVALTGVTGNYQLVIGMSGVQDLAGNVSTAVASTTWQKLLPNQPPMIMQVNTTNVSPNVAFQLQLTASDPEGNNFTYSLANGSPVGAHITTNGVFTWTPSCEEGGTTNVITVLATDDGSPVATGSMNFAIIVSDCVQVQVGSAVTQVGTQGNLPVTVFSSAGVTNLSFVLSYPSNRLGNWTIASSNNAVATAGVVPVDGARALIQVSAASGQTLQGSALLGTLSFVPSNGPSAFLPLSVTNTAAIRTGNTAINSVVGMAGRVVAIGAEPLLEAVPGNAGVPQLTVFGNPGANYQVLTSTNISGPWVPTWQVSMTNLYQSFNLSTPVPQVFYRAQQ
jgi:hypothetical protein